jgi:RNA polymerase sigma factor (sigma-70 family)
MAEEISLNNIDFNRFLSGEKGKVYTYLRKNYSISEDDIDDIYQESSKALYLNWRDGKLSRLTSSLGTYFMKVCINQTLKFLRESSKTIPLIDENAISNKNTIRDDKIDDLYGFCMDTEEEDRKVRMELLVNNIIASMTDTCKNILHGYYWNDFSTTTIADMFSFTSADSVKSQKYKCMNKFRDKYNELRNKIYG